MKKFVSLFSVCLVLVGLVVLMVVPASAATPKEQIIAAAKAATDGKSVAKYLPTMENILNQITVDQTQADKVIAAINVAKAIPSEDKGASLSEYSKAEVSAFLDQLDIAADALGLKYEMVPAENPKHAGDVDCIVYTASGTKLAEVDGDAVKKTNTSVSMSDYLLIAAAGILFAGTVLAIGHSRKAVSAC